MGIPRPLVQRGKKGKNLTPSPSSPILSSCEGSVLYRYSPEGEITLEIRFPNASNITAPVFGGKEMNELYVPLPSPHSFPSFLQLLCAFGHWESRLTFLFDLRSLGGGG